MLPSFHSLDTMSAPGPHPLRGMTTPSFLVFSLLQHGLLLSKSRCPPHQVTRQVSTWAVVEMMLFSPSCLRVPSMVMSLLNTLEQLHYLCIKELPCFRPCCSVTKVCPTLCDSMDCSMPGFLVLHCLPQFFLKQKPIESVILSNHLIFC